MHSICQQRIKEIDLISIKEKKSRNNWDPVRNKYKVYVSTCCFAPSNQP